MVEPTNRKTGKGNQVHLPNNPAVMFLNGDGVERTEKRNDERIVSGVCAEVE